MIKITIPKTELYDSYKNEFIYIKETVLTLEHSLVSISKWEQKYKKPYLSDKEKTNEELLYYIKCMTLTQNVDPNVYLAIPQDEITNIAKYIEDPATATWFSGDKNNKSDNTVITSELIYYWMITLGIYKECEKWHLNRLLTLIRVINVKSSPSKKQNPQKTAIEYSEISRKRREQFEGKD